MSDVGDLLTIASTLVKAANAADEYGWRTQAATLIVAADELITIAAELTSEQAARYEYEGDA